MRPFVGIAAVLIALCGTARAQAVDYELKTYPESPVVFAGDNARTPAPGVPRRQFVTIQSEAPKTVSAVILQQTITRGQKTEIVAIERVAIAMAPREKKRISFAVSDMSAKLQADAQAGEAPVRPVLAVVAVEFIDDSQWNAPTGPGAGHP